MKTEMPASEPSMDEILASIRDIISGDAQGAKGNHLPSNPDDILDLTHALPEEDQKTESIESRKIEIHKTSDFSKDLFEKPKNTSFSSHTSFADPIISPAAMSEAAHTLQSLNKFASQSPKCSSPRFNEGVGGQTIENLVREVLKPLLKEWLDAHLPTLVRWVVNEQVERMVRQANAGQSESTLEKHLTTEK